MRYSEARTGRVFVVRLETGDRLAGVHEIAGVGTIFPDAQGKPSLHLHVALLGTGARREPDPATGFSLLEP